MLGRFSSRLQNGYLSAKYHIFILHQPKQKGREVDCGKGTFSLDLFLIKEERFPRSPHRSFHLMSGQVPTTKSISGKEEGDCQDSLRL